MGKRGHSQNVSLNENYKKLQHEENQLILSFVKDLTEEQRKLFEDMCNLQSDMEFEIILQYYKEGVKIGFLIATECLTE